MQIDLEKLKLELARRQMTFKQLAHDSGLSLQTVYNISSRKRDTRPATVGIIAETLGIPVESILKG